MSATASNVSQPATKQPATSAPRSLAILAVVSLIQLMVIVRCPQDRVQAE